MADTIHVTNPSPPSSGNPEARIGLVERDVSGLKEGFATLSGKVDTGFEKLSSKLESKTSTNWTPIGIVGGALVTIGLTVAGWGFALFGNFQSRTEGSLADIKAAMTASAADRKAENAGLDAKIEAAAEKTMPRVEVMDRLQWGKDARVQEQVVTNARIERTEADVKQLQNVVVPRGEHVEQWSHQKSIDEGIQREVDEVRKQLGDLNSPRDTIQQILRRLDDVERLRRPQ